MTKQNFCSRSHTKWARIVTDLPRPNSPNPCIIFFFSPPPPPPTHFFKIKLGILFKKEKEVNVHARNIFQRNLPSNRRTCQRHVRLVLPSTNNVKLNGQLTFRMRLKNMFVNNYIVVGLDERLLYAINEHKDPLNMQY
jgi:hypothetical protein